MVQQEIIKRHPRVAGRPLVLMSGLENNVAEVAVACVRDWGWDWDLQALWLSDFEWPADRAIAGALIADLPGTKVASRLLAERIPAVRLGKFAHPGDDTLPAVLPDEAGQGVLAADHFHERGFEHVGFIGFHPEGENADHHSMYMAFRERAKEYGMQSYLMNQADISGSDSESRSLARTQATARWLKSLPKPLGIFSFADYMVVRASAACRIAGCSVPEEVALLGAFNSVSCQLTSVPLSSIDPANERRIKITLQLLHDLMAGKTAPHQPILVPPAGVVVRTSTDMLAVPDLAIARALRFIWEHFSENLSIWEIADAVGMPRRSLERGFRVHLNRSVHEELIRKRVSELRNLLISTSEPLADLAPRTGFFTLSNANRCFREAYGTSPGKYRAQQDGN